MSWEAHTTYAGVEVGTALTILEAPQVAGAPPPQLFAPTDMTIFFGDGATAKARVIDVRGDRARLEYGGRTFEMTPATQDDLFANQLAIDMHSKDWVLRREVKQDG